SRAARVREVETQLLVDLVATHLGEIVTLVLEEQVLQQGLRALLCRRLTRAQLAVDVKQRLVGSRDMVLLQRGKQRLGEREPFADRLVAPAECLQQHCYGLTTLTVDPHTDRVALVDVELEPSTP